MKWVIKDCPQCGEKMVLITANFHFRPRLPFNFHCDKCGNILDYGMEKYSADAKSLENDELGKLFMQLLKSK
jgi:transcription initiation factor IIE alpha subunit